MNLIIAVKSIVIVMPNARRTDSEARQGSGQGRHTLQTAYSSCPNAALDLKTLIALMQLLIMADVLAIAEALIS